MRVFYTPEQKKNFIQSYKISPLSMPQFCKEKNLIYTTFHEWVRKDKLKKKEASFVPVVVEKEHIKIATTQSISPEKIILKTQAGFSIESPQSISPCWMSTFVKGVL